MTSSWSSTSFLGIKGSQWFGQRQGQTRISRTVKSFPFMIVPGLVPCQHSTFRILELKECKGWPDSVISKLPDGEGGGIIGSCCPSVLVRLFSCLFWPECFNDNNKGEGGILSNVYASFILDLPPKGELQLLLFTSWTRHWPLWSLRWVTDHPLKLFARFIWEITEKKPLILIFIFKSVVFVTRAGRVSLGAKGTNIWLEQK